MKRSRSGNKVSSNEGASSKTMSDAVNVQMFKELDEKFSKNQTNLVIQNSISANSINDVCQNRKYMQSYDKTFSNIIEPELDTTNQRNSGRCWIFAVLNVARYSTICKYDLEDDFEFS